MRNLHELDKYRAADRQVVRHYGGIGDETSGVFRVPSPIDGGQLLIIASSGAGWDHVSVSRRNRCPNWPEMAYIKKLFFKADEAAMELHVPTRDGHDRSIHLELPTLLENGGQRLLI